MLGMESRYSLLLFTIIVLCSPVHPEESEEDVTTNSSEIENSKKDAIPSNFIKKPFLIPFNSKKLNSGHNLKRNTQFENDDNFSSSEENEDAPPALDTITSLLKLLPSSSDLFSTSLGLSGSNSDSDENSENSDKQPSLIWNLIVYKYRIKRFFASLLWQIIVSKYRIKASLVGDVWNLVSRLSNSIVNGVINIKGEILGRILMSLFRNDIQIPFVLLPFNDGNMKENSDNETDKNTVQNIFIERLRSLNNSVSGTVSKKSADKYNKTSNIKTMMKHNLTISTSFTSSENDTMLPYNQQSSTVSDNLSPEKTKLISQNVPYHHDREEESDFQNLSDVLVNNPLKPASTNLNEPKDTFGQILGSYPVLYDHHGISSNNRPAFIESSQSSLSPFYDENNSYYSSKLHPSVSGSGLIHQNSPPHNYKSERNNYPLFDDSHKKIIDEKPTLLYSTKDDLSHHLSPESPSNPNIKFGHEFQVPSTIGIYSHKSTEDEHKNQNVHNVELTKQLNSQIRQKISDSETLSPTNFKSPSSNFQLGQHNAHSSIFQQSPSYVNPINHYPSRQHIRRKHTIKLRSI